MWFFGKIRHHIRWTASIAVLLTYFFVTTSVDLLHDESCKHDGAGESDTNSTPDNDRCPACMFKAGSNSTQPACQPALVSLQLDFRGQPILHSAYIPCTQWMSSIVLRGPPSAIIS